MNTTSRAYWRRDQKQRRRPRRVEKAPILPLVLMVLGVGGTGSMLIEEHHLADWLLGVRPSETSLLGADMISRRFDSCGSSHFSCVVDGDTFWLDGTKYRIADINTPEISSPQCAREAEMGRRATERLAELLSAGPFSLSSIDRDEDQYGRKLRIVSRDGQSLGLTLVAEGLAHEWQGYREGWC